jgi:hypothetical protein
LLKKKALAGLIPELLTVACAKSQGWKSTKVNSFSQINVTPEAALKVKR